MRPVINSCWLSLPVLIDVEVFDPFMKQADAYRRVTRAAQSMHKRIAVRVLNVYYL